MTLDAFKQTTSQNQPPNDLNPFLLSLWFDAKGDWERSHEIIQELEDKSSAWIHAYLHRKEGDTMNADYWYRRAGRTRPIQSLEEEWNSIASALLNS